jgi:preprotein translocase subunit SecB
VDRRRCFIAEVTYAGLFQIRNVPQEHVHPCCSLNARAFCSRLRARSSPMRHGRAAFPPLMIDPIDFAALYRQRVAEMNVQQSVAAGQG